MSSYPSENITDNLPITIDNFKNFIKKALDSLGIIDTESDQLQTKILNEFDKYNDSTIYQIIQKEGLERKIKNLLEYDNKIKDLLIDPELAPILNSESVRGNWDKTMSSLARLQGLILLRKVTKNCETGIGKIIDAMENKLSAINNILEEELKGESKE